MNGSELRAALAERVRQRGGNPENQTERAAVLGIKQNTLNPYESGKRPVPKWMPLQLERDALAARVAELEGRAP